TSFWVRVISTWWLQNRHPASPRGASAAPDLRDQAAPLGGAPADRPLGNIAHAPPAAGEQQHPKRDHPAPEHRQEADGAAGDQQDADRPAQRRRGLEGPAIEGMRLAHVAATTLTDRRAFPPPPGPGTDAAPGPWHRAAVPPGRSHGRGR